MSDEAVCPDAGTGNQLADVMQLYWTATLSQSGLYVTSTPSRHMTPMVSCQQSSHLLDSSGWRMLTHSVSFNRPTNTDDDEQLYGIRLTTLFFKAIASSHLLAAVRWGSTAGVTRGLQRFFSIIWTSMKDKVTRNDSWTRSVYRERNAHKLK